MTWTIRTIILRRTYGAGQTWSTENAEQPIIPNDGEQGTPDTDVGGFARIQQPMAA